MQLLRPLTGGVMIALVAWASSATATNPGGPHPGPSHPELTRLPEGSLLFIGGNPGRSGNFLVQEHSRAGEGRADALLYIVYRPYEIAPGKQVAQELERLTVNCKARTYESLGSVGYDDAGREVVYLPKLPSEPIKAGSVYATVADVLCDGFRHPTMNAHAGYRLASAAVRALNFGLGAEVAAPVSPTPSPR